MTTTEARSTTRETTATARNRGKARPIVVTLTGSTVVVRLKGTRQSFRIPVAMVFALAIQSHLAAEKHRKKTEKDARRKAAKEQ